MEIDFLLPKRVPMREYKYIEISKKELLDMIFQNVKASLAFKLRPNIFHKFFLQFKIFLHKN